MFTFYLHFHIFIPDVYDSCVEITQEFPFEGSCPYLLASPPPGGRGGMPLSVDRFLITVTRSGNPSSPGRDSISKATPDMLLHKSVLTEPVRAKNSWGMIGEGEQSRNRTEERRETKNVTNEGERKWRWKAYKWICGHESVCMRQRERGREMVTEKRPATEMRVAQSQVNVQPEHSSPSFSSSLLLFPLSFCLPILNSTWSQTSTPLHPPKKNFCITVFYLEMWKDFKPLWSTYQSIQHTWICSIILVTTTTNFFYHLHYIVLKRILQSIFQIKDPGFSSVDLEKGGAVLAKTKWVQGLILPISEFKSTSVV